MEIPILLVEANQDYGNSIRQSLEKTGIFKVTLANRAIEALMRLTESQFRAAIVDFELPDLRGRDLIRQMRGINEKLMILAVLTDQELQHSPLDDLKLNAIIDKSTAPQNFPKILAAKLQLDPNLQVGQSGITGPMKPPPQARQTTGSAKSTGAVSRAPASEQSGMATSLRTIPSKSPEEMQQAIRAPVQPSAHMDQRKNTPVGSHSEPSQPKPSPSTPTGEIKKPTVDSTMSPVEKSQAASTAPPWLQTSSQAEGYLSLLQGEHNAHTAMLIHSGTLWSLAGGIDAMQVKSIVQLLAKLEEGLKTQGAIIRYIRFSGETNDHLLYACPIIEDLLLALVYAAETSFSLARREAQKISRILIHQDPKTYKPAQEPQKIIPKVTHMQEEEGLLQPSGWIPSAIAPAKAPPAGDKPVPMPEPEPLQTEAQSEPIVESIPTISLPEDWLPKQPKPLSHLPFLEEEIEAEQVEEMTALHLPKQEAKYYLPFTVVLIPRFPEHSLDEPLKGQLETWLHKLCVAWDWRVESIEIQPGLLLFTVGLSPEMAPAEAILQLAQNLSARIIRDYPNLARDLPSGYFWAKRYLLSAGSSIAPDRITSFLTSTRQEQGLAQ